MSWVLWSAFTILPLLSLIDGQWISHINGSWGLDRKEYVNAETSRYRMLRMMQSYSKESEDRIMDEMGEESSFENHTAYECGYVMAEIVEKYRKLVEHVKRPSRFKSDNLLETIYRVREAQKHWIEIWHLVMMLHETPRKFRFDKEYNKKVVYMGQDGRSGDKWLKFMQMDTKTAQQKKIKVKADMTVDERVHMYFPDGKLSFPKKKKKKIWPFDYGWEISYWW